MKSVLHVVHCIDTEGPLDEDILGTFERLKSIFGIELEPSKSNLKNLQEKKINLNGKEDSVAKCFAPTLLKYNKNWDEISTMLDFALSQSFRNQMLDDFGGGWVYSWHCMDHIGFKENPRHKDIGYGNIFNYYKQKLNETRSFKDEINWHFHPLSIKRLPLHAATSYVNNYDILNYILCRRILDDGWFPVVNRPGFHSERPDSHQFLENWIPFDYANQYYENENNQPDLSGNRFGDWTRAPQSWRGYNPSHFDYQIEGNCNRKIYRCLNVGTRFRPLLLHHIESAFAEALEHGSAILSFADHDYRDILPDINYVRDLLVKAKMKFPLVNIKFSGAEEAAIQHENFGNAPHPILEIYIENNIFRVRVVSGEIFGPQPYLAFKSKSGEYFHDNLDVVIPSKEWSYVLDDQTILIDEIKEIGVGTAGKFGNKFVSKITL